MTSYDCMTPEELALWRQESAWYKTQTPCVDCPMWFHLQEKAAGRCDRSPIQPGRPHRPQTSPNVRLRSVGQTQPYASEEERIAARRQSWRLSKLRQRGSQRAAAVGE